MEVGKLGFLFGRSIHIVNRDTPVQPPPDLSRNYLPEQGRNKLCKSIHYGKRLRRNSSDGFRKAEIFLMHRNATGDESK